jgi:hypothetical protein
MTIPSDGPPLDPSSAEAQQWVRDELANGRYHAQPSWLQRFIAWLLDLLNGPSTGSLPAWPIVLVVLVVLAVVALVILRTIRREPAARRGGRGASAAVDDVGLSAQDYRRRAQAALGRGAWDDALLDHYRALAASAVERTVLNELPGRTAHEVAVALGAVFPGEHDALAQAADAFDDVRYGHRPTSEARARATADLDARLLRTRPRHDELVSS